MPSLIEAIQEKYCDEEIASNNGMICQFVTFKRNETNFVDSNRIPPILVLNKYQIENVGDEKEVQDICKDVKELDLAHNELSDWNQIHKLFHSTPRLQFLNLSFNNLNEPIQSPSIFLHEEIPVFSKLSTLILIGTNISWDSIWILLQNMVQLQELHLSKNNFTEVGVGIPGTEEMTTLAMLKRFVFNENPIESWEEVNKIGKCFPCLEHLGLANTLISSIDPASHANFSKLKSLSLSSTKINEMAHVSCLHHFPSLTELRIQGTLVFSDLTAHERRQLTIALLPNVTKLNGTIISASERDGSERAFIRYFDQLHLEANKPDRYNELTSLHGKLQPLVCIDLKPISKVTLRFMFEDQSIVKQVKVHQTTNDLKNIVETLFGIEPRRMRLFYEDIALSEGYGREEMRFPLKYLYSYNPTDNDEIHVVLRK